MPNNMGMVRYILALVVVINHFNLLVGNDFYFPVSSYEAVGGFFVLSGFLIYGSYLHKQTSPIFLAHRARRLLPPYITIVVLCAFGLVAVSSLTPSAYFSSADFWKYLATNLTFLNFLHPTLPGVFDSLNVQAVNGSLWTMKIEWVMYLSVIPTAWLVNKVHSHKTLVFVLIYLLSSLYSFICHCMYDSTEKEIWLIMGRQVFGQVAYFYIGVFIYYWFDIFMKYRWQLLCIALALYSIRSILPYGTTVFIDPICFGIIVIFLSMVGSWGKFENQFPNISYSIYIVHWPVFQLIALSGIKDKIGINLTFIISLTIVLIISYLIYFAIEEPIRRHFNFKSKTVKAPRLY